MPTKRISYLGPEGTFSDHAAHIYASENWERVPYSEMNLELSALENGEVDEAIAPIENSIGGAVIDTVDFLIRSETVMIKSELLVKIEQCLITRAEVELANITQVISKPEALAQCRRFLEANIPLAERVGAPSTADAVNIVKSGSTEMAAIAPRRAADLAGLPVLFDNIQDRQNNVTRFVVLGYEDHEPTGNDKTSIAFSFLDRDSPGQLHAVLGIFARCHINLAKIESRPTGEELGRYVFLLDFLGHRKDSLISGVLSEMKEHASWVKVMGSYPVADGVV